MSNEIQSEMEAAFEEAKQRSMLPPSLREDDASQYLAAMNVVAKVQRMIQQPAAMLGQLAYEMLGDAATVAQRSELCSTFARTWANRQSIALAAKWKIAPHDRPDVTGANVIYYSDGEQREYTDPCLVFQKIDPASLMYVAGKREAVALLYVPSGTLEPQNIGTDEFPIIVPTHRRSVNERTGEVSYWPEWSYELGFVGVAAYFESARHASLVLASGQNALSTLRRLAREARAREEAVRDPIREVAFGPSDREYEAASRPAPRQQPVC